MSAQAAAISASVIVPSARGGPALRELLASLEDRPELVEVILVDNGSPDHDVATAAEALSGVSAIALDENVGYGRAINIAARQARGRALILLNDDSVLDPGFVEAILRPLDPDRRVTMVAGVLREAASPDSIDLAGIACSATLVAFPYLNGEPLQAAETAVAPIGPAGAAAAIDRDAFMAIGGFDEAIFAYGEDLDLALRLRERGGVCALAPDARGTHAHSSTLGTGSRQKNYLAGFGRGYVARKWSVLRSPVRAPRALLGDVAICAGQAFADRNLAGVSGRLDGYRAGHERRPFPAEVLRGVPRGDGPIRGLTRRVVRRRRLRAQDS